MILDDIVSAVPNIRDLIKNPFIVRVPFKLIGAVDGETELPRQFLQLNEKGQISWDGIRLPYDELVIMSQFNETHVLYVMQEGNVITVVSIGVKGNSAGVRQYVFLIEDGLIKTPNPTEEISKILMNAEFNFLNYLEVGNSENEIRESLERIHKDDSKYLNTEAAIYSMLLSATAALFSCKNIVVEKVVADKPIQEKRKRSGKLPLYSYHVLKVKPSMVKGGSLIGHGEPVAIHWVRGHFKKFTEEKKLFGKHIGLYWWQPHLAGNALRYVDKDYQLGE